MLFIGDVVGSLGREALATYVPKLKKKYRPRVVIASGENVAPGRGITDKIYKRFLQDGVDVVTMNDHMWDNRDTFEFIDDAKKMVRPANFPEGVPGQGMILMETNQLELAVVNLQAHTFMVSLKGPFKKAAELVAIACKRTPFIFVDFYGETVSEKQAISWFLDGQVSAVVGTHMHAQMNDAQILPKGTAFLSDVGMTGLYDGTSGMRRRPTIEKFMTVLPKRFEIVETGWTILSTYTLKIDDQMGQAKMIELIQVSGGCPSQE